MKPNKRISKRLMCILLSVLIVISATIPCISVMAAVEKCELSIRTSTNYKYMNNWAYPNSRNGIHLATVKTGSHKGEVAYCIEFGKDMGDDGQEESITDLEDIDAWNDMSTTQKNGITRATIYGYPNYTYGVSNEAAQVATQFVIWEYSEGYRTSADGDNVTAGLNGTSTKIQNAIDAAGFDVRQQYYKSGVKEYSDVETAYKGILNGIKNHKTVPSFDTNTVELKWSSANSRYEATVSDSNKVLSNFKMTCSNSDIKFSTDNNKLTIYTTKTFSNSVSVKMTKTSTTVGADIGFVPANKNYNQSLVGTLTDPVTANFKIEVASGNAKVIKTSEDGKVSGIKFTLSGNGITKTDVTDKNGEIIFGNVPAGTYTVTEESIDIYETQSAKTVTVVGGETKSVSFSNKLKRGDLTVTKTCEDGLNEGIKFHLYGTSLSGVKIDEYATTNSKGIATFKDILIGTGYTIEEVDTAIRYVVPDKQTTKIEWNIVTNKDFNNDLKKGNIEILKNSEDNIVKGFTFEVKGSDGKTYNATTNSKGIAKLTDLPVYDSNNKKITYTIKETDVPTRYVTPDNQTITLEPEKTSDITFNNILKKFRVKVTKEDIEKGKAQGDATLAGAVYGLYKGETLVAEYTTDSNASFTTDYFVCAYDWTIKEITSSDGYLVNDKAYKVGAKPELYTVEFNTTTNKVQEQVIKGNISIIKHTDNGDTQIETPEKNAEFQVYLKSAGSYAKADPDERDTIICDEDGFASTKKMPYGVYTVHQTKGWEGREKIKDFDVFISKDGKTYKFLINNSNFESYIKVVKLDKETGKQIAYEGAAFEIYDKDGHRVSMQFTYPTVTSIHTFYTNSEGYLITPEKLPYGDYTLVEVTAPYGYVLDDTPIPFTVNQENSSTDTGVTVIKVKAYDMAQKGYIEITKTGEIFSTVTENNGIYTPIYEIGNLKNAVFQIYAAEDISTLDGTIRVYNGELVDEITTDNGGVAKSKELYLGKYTIIEKTAPNGYVNSNEQYNVEITYAGQNVSVTSTALSVYNERQRVSISLAKAMEIDEVYNIGNNDEILSVQFGIFADEDIKANDGSVIPADSLITLATCDKDGNITFSCDLPIGFKFYAKEVSADSHYILSNARYSFVSEYAGQNIKIAKIALNDGQVISNEIKRGNVNGLKVGENNDGLENALIGIFAPNTTEFTKENAIVTVTSDNNGIFAFEGVPYGEWIVKEISAPTGYVLDNTEHHIYITDNDITLNIRIKNDKIRGNLEISKTDVSSGEVLANVGFRIYDKDKNIIAEGVTDKNGICTFNDLNYGEYYYQEFSCDDAYILDDSLYPFSITEDGVTVKAKMTNRMKKGQLVIHKVDKENKNTVLKDVEFTVTDKDGNIIAVGKTDKTGTVTFDLPYGEYIYYESKTLKGYVLDDTKHEISITDDGQIIDVTVKNEKEKKPSNPKTSDDSNIGLWIAVACVSGIGIGTALVYLIKKRKNEEVAE